MLTKILVVLISTVNVYLGFRFFLNVIHVLNTSKYSRTATAIYAVVFLGMGVLALYFSFIRAENKIALWIGVGPWLFILVFLLINMVTGDYK